MYNLFMKIPECPLHGPMKLVTIIQGEGTEYERELGKVWFCVNDDNTSSDYCDNCEDYVEEPEQLEMFHDQQ